MPLKSGKEQEYFKKWQNKRGYKDILETQKKPLKVDFLAIMRIM